MFATESYYTKKKKGLSFKEGISWQGGSKMKFKPSLTVHLPVTCFLIT